MATIDDVMARLELALPAVAPGDAGGVLIAGTNAATTFYGDGVAALTLHGENYGNMALSIVGGEADTPAVMIWSAAGSGVAISGLLGGLLLQGQDRDSLALSIVGKIQTDSATDVTGTVASDVGVRKALAFLLPFFLLNSTDHVTPQDGLTVVAKVQVDGGDWNTCINPVVDTDEGAYKILMDPTEMDGDTILLKFTATGADPLCMTIKTSS